MKQNVPIGFRSKLAAPPGGMFFYERDGHRVTAQTYDTAVSSVSRLLNELGVRADPETELASYMCPRLGPAANWFCTSPAGARLFVSARDAMEGSLGQIARHRVVPFDRIERRLQVCQRCPKHERNWCPTCAGHFERILVALARKRPRLPADALAGVCACAKAYESAVCSLEYPADERVWADAPETCWRRENDV